jgi:hypothetical protein
MNMLSAVSGSSYWRDRFEFPFENGLNGIGLNSPCKQLLFPLPGTDKGISMILHRIHTTHSSNVANIWTTVPGKALQLFGEILAQGRSYWRFRCNRPVCPPIELSKCATTEWHLGEIVPELWGSPAA